MAKSARIISTLSEALTAIKVAPVLVVNVGSFIDDFSLNYRDAADYVGDTLAADMLENGQHEPILGTRTNEDDKILIIRGYRRFSQFKLAKERNLVFLGGPYDGKAMADNVEVRILGPIDPAVREELHMDHSQRKSLSRSGLHRAVEKALDAKMSERSIVVKLADLFGTHYPVDSPDVKDVTVDKGASLLEFHRGTIQGMRALWQSPTVLKDAYYDVLQGKRKWPTQGEMKSLSKVYMDEKAKDATLSINSAKPGPLFLTKWQAIVDKHEKAVAEGKTKARAQVMMSNLDVTKLSASRDSAILRLDCRIILKTVDDNTDAALDAFLTKLEAAFTEEQKKELATIIRESGVSDGPPPEGIPNTAALPV